MHGTRPGGVVHSNHLYVGASGPLGEDGLDEDGGLQLHPRHDERYEQLGVVCAHGGMHGLFDSAASLGLEQDHWGSGGVGE